MLSSVLSHFHFRFVDSDVNDDEDDEDDGTDDDDDDAPYPFHRNPFSLWPMHEKPSSDVCTLRIVYLRCVFMTLHEWSLLRSTSLDPTRLHADNM